MRNKTLYNFKLKKNYSISKERIILNKSKFEKNDLFTVKNIKNIKNIERKIKFKKEENNKQIILPIFYKFKKKIEIKKPTNSLIKILNNCEYTLKNLSYNKNKENENKNIDLSKYEKGLKKYYLKKKLRNFQLSKKSSKVKKSFHLFQKNKITVDELIYKDKLIYNKLKSTLKQNYSIIKNNNNEKINNAFFKIESNKLKKLITNAKIGNISYFKENYNNVKNYINDIDFFGRTCIFYTVIKKRINLLEFLLNNYNIDLSIIDIKNKNIIYYAIKKKYYRIIIILLLNYFQFKIDKSSILDRKILNLIKNYDTLISNNKIDELKYFLKNQLLII